MYDWKPALIHTAVDGSKQVDRSGHTLLRMALDPLLESLALFETPEDLTARIRELFRVPGPGSVRDKGER